MATSQLVLTGVPAFIGAVVGPTTVRFFIDENDFDPAHLIEVDLANNTKTKQAQAWAQDVDVDHQLPGGLTTIGPTFHSGNYCGMVYLSERLVTKYASTLAAWPPKPDAIYQFQAVVRDDGIGNLARYHGFKVRVLSPAVGSLVHVAFIRVGESAPAADAVRRWIDLADAAVCDPAANGFTTVTSASPVGTDSALFLSAPVIAAGGPSYPKFPRNLGW